MRQARDEHGILTNREHLLERLKDVGYGGAAVLAVEGLLFLLHVLGRL